MKFDLKHNIVHVLHTCLVSTTFTLAALLTMRGGPRYEVYAKIYEIFLIVPVLVVSDKSVDHTNQHLSVPFISIQKSAIGACSYSHIAIKGWGCNVYERNTNEF